MDNLIIYGHAQAFRIDDVAGLVALEGRLGALAISSFLGQPIELLSGDTGANRGGKLLENLGDDAARLAHHGYFGRSF